MPIQSFEPHKTTNKPNDINLWENIENFINDNLNLRQDGNKVICADTPLKRITQNELLLHLPSFGMFLRYSLSRIYFTLFKGS